MGRSTSMDHEAADRISAATDQHPDSDTESLVPAYIEYGSVPARPNKGEPAHFHLDFGFAMTTADGDIGQLQTSEVTGASWLDLGAAQHLVGPRMARAGSQNV